ncbi:hypothetical protein [Dactylosporangium sp. NPDC006015]|uniref:hypothetical protein n=1 Tax=Dactylosporangium sp. NPDC006015 TaxID=3154576 RepID=UPI0033B81D46
MPPAGPWLDRPPVLDITCAGFLLGASALLCRPGIALLHLLYATVAVAVLGGGGPPDEDGGFTARGTVTDRLANNIVDLAVGTLLIAMVGWAAAALAGNLPSIARRGGISGRSGNGGRVGRSTFAPE